MSTVVYFVRHAQPDFTNHDDRTRGLTAKGLSDRQLVCEFFRQRSVDMVLSSPYRRAMDTVATLALEKGLVIQPMEDFRERQVADGWIEDFDAYAKAQWADFSYALPGGECLREVQQRNLRALSEVLTTYAGQHIVIGGHGTAISVVLDHYCRSFGYAGFDKIRNWMPWVSKMQFMGDDCVAVYSHNLFTGERECLYEKQAEAMT